MRAYATFFVISVMTLGLLFLLVTRSRVPHAAPLASPVVETVVDAGVEAGASGRASLDADGGAVLANGSGGEAGTAPSGPRPLRIVALGWELAAPGVSMVSSGAKPAIDIAPESELDAVSARLARGGDSLDGADLAVLPAPAFVVAYEKLRALDPRVIAVVGFSRGREELRAAQGALLKALPGADDVKLVAYAPQMSGSAEARTMGSESATVLGLAVLRAMGAAPSRVRLLAPGTADARGASFAALARGATDDRKTALSTADASRLVPIVLVAPRAALDAKTAAFTDVTRAWLEANGVVAKDPAGLARAIADRSAVPLVGADAGARPDALTLVDRMGRVESTALSDQGTLLLGTTPGSLSGSMGLAWSLAREGGLTTAATPDPLPVDARIVKALGATAPPPVDPAPAADPDAGVETFAPAPANATPLFVMRDPGLAAAAAAQKGKAPSATDLATLAGTSAPELVQIAALFPRAVLRVSAPSGEKNARVFAGAARAAGVPAARLATTAAAPAGGGGAGLVAVEVLVVP